MSSSNPTVLASGKFLSLIKELHWEYAKRINSPGAAVIVAVTDDRKLVLVEQYRIPVHSRTIELPAGIIGDEPGKNDEAHADAAGRELEEETGYAAGEIKLLNHGAASSGLASELITLFLASKLKRTGKGGGVANEEIVVHEVPLAEIDAWLAAKAASGILVDTKIYAGLYFVGRHLGWPASRCT